MGQFIYLVIAVSASIGFGHSRADAQVINGCVSKNGTLKIVADPSDCSSREIPISWNQQGPQGDTGDMGEPGEPGMDGEPGADAAVLRVFDATNTEIGLFTSGGDGGFRVFHEPTGVMISVDKDGTLVQLYPVS